LVRKWLPPPNISKSMSEKQKKRHRRHKRLRAKVSGAKERPRLCIFRSNKHIYAQLIDDEKGKTLLAASDNELKQKGRRSSSKKEKVAGTGGINRAFEVGKLIAQKSLEKKIEKVVFDKGGYKYHGQVKALAEGAREGGLKF
jgi:large subunit ribosomal protein L18